MKISKSTSAILLASLVIIAAKAQKLNSTVVPAAVKAAFAKAHPTVKSVKWEKEKGDYEAGYTQNGNEMSAVFKANGTQLESEMEISISALPTSVKSYVTRHYPAAKIKEASKITKANGAVNYEADVNGKDLLFDAAGKFIEAAKD